MYYYNYMLHQDDPYQKEQFHHHDVATVAAHTIALEDFVVCV